MKFGVCGNLSRLPVIQDAGYDYIEMNFSTLALMSEEEFIKTREELARVGMRAEAFNGFFKSDVILYGEKADLDAIADLDNTQLRNLLDEDRSIFAAAVVESVAVATEPHAAVEDAIGTHDSPFAQRDLRVDVRSCPDTAPLADEDLRLDHRTITDHSALLHVAEMPDLRTLTDRASLVGVTAFVYKIFLVFHKNPLFIKSADVVER